MSHGDGFTSNYFVTNIATGPLPFKTMNMASFVILPPLNKLHPYLRHELQRRLNRGSITNIYDTRHQQLV